MLVHICTHGAYFCSEGIDTCIERAYKSAVPINRINLVYENMGICCLCGLHFFERVNLAVGEVAD